MRRHDKLLIVYGISVLLGVLTGLVGSVFQIMIHKTNKGMEWLFAFGQQYDIPVMLSAAILSMVMVLIAWLMVHYIAPEASGSGVQEIEGALMHERPIFWRRLLPVKFVAGVLAISSKLVMGREGPTIQMGGNLGDMLGEMTHLQTERRNTLIAAGASAGLAVAFNAPLAGVLFVIEEMRTSFNFSFTNFTIASICCVMATIIYRMILGSGAVIVMDIFSQPSLSSLGLFFIFGIVVGFVGWFFNVMLMKSLNWTDKFTYNLRILFVLFIGALVGVLYVFHPAFVGGGYIIIEQTLKYSPALSVLTVLFIVRFIMTMLCYSTAVPGGIFAPMLALGTILGLMASYFTGVFLDDATIHPGMFAVAGMGALFAAAVRAPVTGIILVVEMTQNYLLILPLMVTCLTATMVVHLAGNPPIYSQLLSRTLKRSRM